VVALVAMEIWKWTMTWIEHDGKERVATASESMLVTACSGMAGTMAWTRQVVTLVVHPPPLMTLDSLRLLEAQVISMYSVGMGTKAFPAAA